MKLLGRVVVKNCPLGVMAEPEEVEVRWADPPGIMLPEADLLETLDDLDLLGGWSYRLCEPFTAHRPGERYLVCYGMPHKDIAHLDTLTRSVITKEPHKASLCGQSRQERYLVTAPDNTFLY
jgi:hypothetical protein